MALPHFIKYIYSNGTEEVIKRGKKIFNSGNIEIIQHDELAASIHFRVKDDAYASWYKVHVLHYKNPQEMSLRCTCPYNLSDMCKHEAAVLFELQQMSDSNRLGGMEANFQQQHTVLHMKRIELPSIRLLTSRENFEAAEEFLRTDKAVIISAENEIVKAEVAVDKNTYNVIIQKNKERNFDTSCDCNSDTHHPVCMHKAVVLLQLLGKSGADFFDSIRNWDREKNQLLGLYGYSLDDDLDNKFEFSYKDGKPYLRVLDTSIKRVANPNVYNPQTVPAKPLKEEVDVLEEKANQKAGIVLQQDEQQYPFIKFTPVKAEVNEEQNTFISPIEIIDLNKFVNADKLDEEDKQLIQQLRKIMPSEVSRYLNRNSPFSAIWDNIIQQHDEPLTEDTRKLIIEYLYPKYKKLFQSTANNYFTFYLPSGKNLQSANIELANYSINYVSPSFEVLSVENGYEIICNVDTLLGEKRIDENELNCPLIFQVENQFYLWHNAEDAMIADKFLPGGKMFFPQDTWEVALYDFVLPLSKNYKVNFSGIAQEELANIEPEIRVNLSEKGDYLVLEPVFIYLNHKISAQDNDKIIIPQNDKLLIIHRNKEAENIFFQKVQALHSGFAVIDNRYALALKGTEVLKNNWFFLFVDAMRDMNVPVYGFESLKKYKFNTAKPTTLINLSSNTDWFDAKVNIDFGGQKVSIEELKKALSNKQQVVELKDGTLGVLPEEWLKKYSLLFQVGDAQNGSLRLSKYHFSVVDELYAQRDESELIFQLEEKYENIRQKYSIAPIDAPEHLQPILRPYQLSGFQWLNYLNDVHWGGILADDMGLGKTIQTLTFLSHLKKNSETFKALVVCPTSLLYNWENEIKKFTPHISYFIHHGSTRSYTHIKDEGIDIIITTYGTLRSDIKEFSEINFSYVVLDESQAIKNPQSKIAKAVNLLKASNRLCLSGTPLQNNTFDIYAQMNFLNPGLLGSIDWFKQQFAIPIDKFGEQQQKEHLRKLLFPFILRRTKEQVAKDLPAKTEQVLFCEMGTQQRKIYDAYRNDVRDKILGLIEEQGVQRSQLTILQGLMKLRQICDSPAILKDDDYPNYSVKIDELGKELEENLSNHKALIFSQFLGMLSLIKTKLEALGIKYEYFDGSTSINDREKAIQNFQNDDECRVFLISLKAGGVGLNLTAADYVYIVDPWWNPAVEQQAIDRTHRIGQTKNIFAYRMICKDTVEDKILQLQEKKRALANELISDDGGFVKNLSREDIEYLFS
ncbi:helicase SNF2 [Arachidicoccus ginsenosidimutans]|uniref:DEAD/DEAH box helicase n=1 Tax=Arachidicoccus sp. BS20 TaxID=1850526 RepID=UPI0007F0CC2D|nr:DEAD/DEAH box helicase [Arachidicoccus sp. BS20]ANI90687.1 helicase SNF2 [Arachidicoccus sp. BS20]